MIDLITLDKKIKQLFPTNLASFEQMGYLYSSGRKIEKIALGLGLSIKLVQEAISMKADLLLIHNGPEKLTVNSYYQEIKTLAKKSRLSIYRVHLPMDFAKGGLIDNLSKLLRFRATSEKLIYQEKSINGGVYLAKGNFNYNQIISRLRGLNPVSIRAVGGQKKKYHTVAITTGDGCKPEFLIQIKPDAFICGLINQESERIARDLGITIFETTSYSTENEPLKIVYKSLKKLFKDVDIYFLDLGDSMKILGGGDKNGNN